MLIIQRIYLASLYINLSFGLLLSVHSISPTKRWNRSKNVKAKLLSNPFSDDPNHVVVSSSQ
jgi:hypothetical protein